MWLSFLAIVKSSQEDIKCIFSSSHVCLKSAIASEILSSINFGSKNYKVPWKSPFWYAFYTSNEKYDTFLSISLDETWSTCQFFSHNKESVASKFYIRDSTIQNNDQALTFAHSSYACRRETSHDHKFLKIYYRTELISYGKSKTF